MSCSVIELFCLSHQESMNLRIYKKKENLRLLDVIMVNYVTCDV